MNAFRTKSRLAAVLALIVLAVGCSDRRAPATSAPPAADYVAAADLRRLLRESPVPVLVEFGVMAGCARCDAMRSPVEELAQELGDAVQVRRVNFNYEKDLVRELGLAICPTYVAFRQGEERFRVSYPTSSAQLRELLAVEMQP
jgi:thioredoxin-like negative regulator of GroEL